MQCLVVIVLKFWWQWSDVKVVNGNVLRYKKNLIDFLVCVCVMNMTCSCLYYIQHDLLLVSLLSKFFCIYAEIEMFILPQVLLNTKLQYFETVTLIWLYLFFTTL